MLRAKTRDLLMRGSPRETASPSIYVAADAAATPQQRRYRFVLSVPQHTRCGTLQHHLPCHAARGRSPQRSPEFYAACHVLPARRASDFR